MTVFVEVRLFFHLPFTAQFVRMATPRQLCHIPPLPCRISDGNLLPRFGLLCIIEIEGSFRSPRRFLMYYGVSSIRP